MDKLESRDRRLFLLGATLTSAGLVVPRSIISIPKPMETTRHVKRDWSAMVSRKALAFHESSRVWLFQNGASFTFGTVAAALAASGDGKGAVIQVFPGHREVIDDTLDARHVRLEMDGAYIQGSQQMPENGTLLALGNEYDVRNSAFIHHRRQGVKP